MEPTTTQALAARLAEAIRTLAAKPENLNVFQVYLGYNFHEWMDRYAYNPAGLTAELERFAAMKL